MATKDGALTILLQFVAGFTVLFLIPTDALEFSRDPQIYGLLFAAIIFYALNDRIQTTTRKHLEVSEISIISQLSNVFIIVYGITIFREDIIFTRIIGALLVLLGNVLVLYKKGKLEFSRYSILAIMSTLVFATAISIDVGISEQFNLPIYISATLTIPIILILLFDRISLGDLKSEFVKTNKMFLLFTGFFWGLSIFFILNAYQEGDVTTVAPLAALNVLLNVIVAFFVHKETTHIFRKVIAAIIVLIGIYMTVI